MVTRDARQAGSMPPSTPMAIEKPKACITMPGVSTNPNESSEKL